MKNTGNQPESDLSDEKVISILVEGVISNELTIENDLKDPFDVYTHQLRAKLFSHPEVFKKRCLQGYRNLMKELR